MFCFQFLATPGQNLLDGKDFGFWSLGHVVFGVCVVIANTVMCFRFNNHQGWGEILCFGSILVYYTVLFAQGFLKMFP